MKYMDNNGRCHDSLAGTAAANAFEKSKIMMQLISKIKRRQKRKSADADLGDNPYIMDNTTIPDEETYKTDTSSPRLTIQHSDGLALAPKESLDDSDTIRADLAAKIDNLPSLPSAEKITGIINSALRSNNESIRKLANGRNDSNVFTDEFIDCAASVINSAIQTDPDTVIKGGEPLLKKLFSKLNDKINDE